VVFFFFFLIGSASPFLILYQTYSILSLLLFIYFVVYIYIYIYIFFFFLFSLWLAGCPVNAFEAGCPSPMSCGAYPRAGSAEKREAERSQNREEKINLGPAE
jgi:hypothetical protein